MSLELIEILMPAFCAGILVLSTHVILGIQVLKRGIIFMDLAIAQVAAIGIIIFHSFDDLLILPWGQYWMPALLALSSAYLIGKFEKRLAHELEAIIGCVYVLAAVIAILLIAKNPHGGELLKTVLTGNILWVSWSQLILPSIITIFVFMLIKLKPSMLSRSGFYLIFALVVTSSLELVGVYLVFSSLIFPALATNNLKQNLRIPVGLAIGIIGYLLGLSLSTVWDLPSGATIVLSIAVSSIVLRLISIKSTQSESC